MSQITKTTLSDTWTRCSKLPMGNQLFSFFLGRMARYTGTIGATVVELAVDRRYRIARRPGIEP